MALEHTWNVYIYTFSSFFLKGLACLISSTITRHSITHLWSKLFSVLWRKEFHTTPIYHYSDIEVSKYKVFYCNWECDSRNTLTLLLLQTFSDGFSFTKVPMLLRPLRKMLITKVKFLSCAGHSLSFSTVRYPPVLSTCLCFPMFIGKETETKTDKGHI